MRKFHSALGDLLFCKRTAPGKLLDHVAIAVTTLKIHLCINAGGIEAKRLFDGAFLLNKALPVDAAQRAQAQDALAHFAAVGSLLSANHFPGRVAEMLDSRQPQHEGNAHSSLRVKLETPW